MRWSIKEANIMKVYVAYGSNLNIEQMARRCPDAKVIGKGVLKGYRLAFRGYATIEQDPFREVPVAVWNLSNRCVRALDRYEGYPDFYRKEEVDVEVGGKMLKAIVYIMNSGKPAMPSVRYLKTVYDGYNDVGLDLHYLETAIEDTKLRDVNWGAGSKYLADSVRGE